MSNTDIQKYYTKTLNFAVILILCLVILLYGGAIVGGLYYAHSVNDVTDSLMERTELCGESLCASVEEPFFNYFNYGESTIIECEHSKFKLTSNLEDK